MSRNLTKIALFSCVLMLCSCSNNNINSNDNHRLFYNTYDSYSDMQNHMEVLNEKIPENEQLIFDFTIDGFTTKYFVAGVDMCVANKVITSIEEHNDTRCDYLYTREVYYELSNLDLIATIVFKNKVDIDLTDMFWTNQKLGFHGTVLNYEQNANGDMFYLRKGDNDILALKFNVPDVDDVIVKSFQDKLTESVLKS